MVELNIAGYNEGSEDGGTWENVPNSDATVPVAGAVEDPYFEGDAPEQDLFALAQSITNRSYSRRRIRRSSAII